MDEDLYRHFIQEPTWIANKHLKICTTSLLIIEMPIRTKVNIARPLEW